MPTPRRPGLAALALALAAAGCSGGASRPSSTTTPPPPTADVPPAPPPAPSGSSVGDLAPEPAPPACAERPPARPGLIVASEAGVREVDADGQVIRTVSRTPAAFPRYLPGRRDIVFLVPERGELRRLSLDTCAERAVATLPRDAGLGCGGVWSGPYDPARHIQSDEDFVVDPRGEVACARVMDRNVNMSNVHVLLEVRLATGAQAHQVAFPDTCAEARLTKDFACARALGEVRPPSAATLPGPATQALPFAVADLQAKLPAKGVGSRAVTRVALTEPELESASPSGRWAVLGGNRDEGDYIYRELLLFDRQTGHVFPLHPGPWPPPLSAAALGDRDAMAEAGVRVIGETTVRWLGGGDTLLIDTLLVEPGRRAVQLPGALAW